MCLSNLIEFDLPKEREIPGLEGKWIPLWKVITGNATPLHKFSSSKFKLGNNRRSHLIKKIWSHYGYYQAGFHCLLSRKSARQYRKGYIGKIIKCYAKKKDIVAQGYQSCIKTVVCKNIYIHSLAHQR